MKSATVHKGSRRTQPPGKTLDPVTKGSRGKPKASRSGAARGHTHENQTTSTNVPHDVPKSFLNKLGEMHTGERELVFALPLVAKAAKSKDLKTLLNIHLKQTKNHVKALDQVAKSLGKELPMKRCKPMTKLVKDGVEVIAKRIISGEKDDELIAVGKKIEQFEIDSYTPLCAEAEKMEFTHEHALLTSILNQEKLAHELLDALGEGKGPLGKLVKKVSLEHAGADLSRPRAA